MQAYIYLPVAIHWDSHEGFQGDPSVGPAVGGVVESSSYYHLLITESPMKDLKGPQRRPQEDPRRSQFLSVANLWSYVWAEAIPSPQTACMNFLKYQEVPKTF